MSAGIDGAQRRSSAPELDLLRRSRAPAPHELVLLGAIPLVVLVFRPDHGQPFALKEPLAALLLLVAATAWLASGLGRRPLPAPLAASAALLASGALASGLSAANRDTWREGALTIVASLLVFLLGARSGLSRSFRRSLGPVLMVTATCASLLALIQASGLVDASFGLQALGKMKVFSTLGNPNFVACHVLAALPFALSGLTRARGRVERAALGAVAVVFAFALAASGSRSGWLAAGVASAAALLLRAQTARARRAAGTLVFALTVLATGAGLVSHTGRGRLLIWLESLEIWSRHPWTGVGLGNFNVHQLEAQERVLGHPRLRALFFENASFVFDAHDQYLQVLVEGGPLAFAGFTALCLLVLVRGARRARRSALHRSLHLAFVAQLAFFLWNTPLQTASVAVPFWLIAAVLVAPLSRGRPVLSRQAGVARRIPAALPAVAAALAFPWLLSLERAGALARRGGALLESGPFDRAVATFREAIVLSPGDGELREKLALALFLAERPEEALLALGDAERRFGDVGIPYLEAEILARSARHHEAAAIYRRIARAFPQHVTPHFMLGQIYLRLEEWGLAREALERTVTAPASPQNLKLDRAKVARQRALAALLLEQTPELQTYREEL